MLTALPPPPPKKKKEIKPLCLCTLDRTQNTTKSFSELQTHIIQKHTITYSVYILYACDRVQLIRLCLPTFH